ncbi:MAG TPA: carbohydrate ABC transporter permease [Candidatus Fimadaptatus faecigallinarum]|uniref:Carbohydrate ABC transporter permease n=1 Tax=Candidatus Fimadaptatus faecigallinarum TaxID=2840814 RepID=A0A9D1LQB9_9FIRM|nr:carbohydrate ABC transporter permease [Candidatus Fimadaptatus faecigallinarum]
MTDRAKPQARHGLKNKNGDSIITDIVIYVIFTLFTLLCVFPFYYIFINTISNNQLVTRGQIMFWPVGVHLGNYREVLKLNGLAQAAFISVARTVLGTGLTLLGTMFLGYAMSRQEYWHHKFWYRFVVITMYFNAGLIPWFINMKNLGLLNNFLAYILPGMVSPFYMILYKTYVESIPASLEESAQLDGAGYLVRFFRIIFPLSMAMLATIAVFTAVAQWNSFTDTLFLMTSSKMYTLQFLLYQYLSEADSVAALIRSNPAMVSTMDMSNTLTATSVRMTITVVVVLPVLCVYPFFQRFFIKGIMIGAVKG